MKWKNGRIVLSLALVAIVQTTDLSAADVRFDGSTSLQVALDAGAGGTVTISKGVWQVDPGFVSSNTEVVFEEGAELEANPRGFFGKDDCVLTVREQTNVVIRGGTIRMHRQDYLDKKDGRVRSQWRHGVSLRAAVNVRVEDMRFFECGGDGVYVADWNRRPCRRIIVRNTLLSRGLRQGMSVIDVEGLLLEDCVFERTLGENPQAGIDFEPNHEWNRMKDIVVRRCVFRDNVRKGINLHLDSLSAASDPIGFLIEDCTTVSNAIGFGICFNTKDGGFPRGNVLVQRCRFASSREQGIDITQKPDTCARLVFRDVLVEDSCTEAPKLGDVQLLTHYAWDRPNGGIRFENVRVRQSRKGPWILAENNSRTPCKPVDFSGDVTVVDPDGNSTVVSVDEVWAHQAFPPAPGREIRPFAAPDWATFVPPPIRGTELERIQLRGHLNFVFYVDTARTVRFRGGLRDPEVATDRVADLQFRSFDDLLHRPIARMHPSGCRDAEFSFEAPAPGWYVLYAHPGRNGFFLTGCDAPIYFSLGKTRGFDPTMPCIALGVE